MGMEDELIWTSFSAKMQKFRFSKIFAIVNPIIIFKILAMKE